MKCNTFAVRDGGVAMGTCYSQLSSVEREEISRAVALGFSMQLIARQLGRSASTVSRELRRNAECPARYRATVAQWRAQRRARVARRPRKLVTDRWLRRYVGRRLQQGWSPQQIAARLRRDYPQDVEKRISHETIYAAIYIVPRGELRRTLIRCLRQHRKVRRRRYRSWAQARRHSQPYADCGAPDRSRSPVDSRTLGGRHHQGSSQWFGGRHGCGANHAPGAACPYAWT